MLTMKDVAERVGVSVSTVSLVLSGRDRGRVNPKAAAQVRAAADELGYVPNLVARGLRTKQSRTLGVLADGVATIPFAGPMLAGAQETAWEAGYLLMLIDIGHNSDLEAPAVRALLQRHIEALVVAVEFHSVVQLPSVPRRLPVVVMDGVPAASSEPDASRADWVVPDEEGGAHTAVSHLISRGHRRIGYCNVSDGRFIAADLRLQGYQRALAEAGVTPDPGLVVQAAGPDTVDGMAVALELLGREDRPTAVFCFSDKLAMAVYHAARRLGLSVPDDLSIVGFDDQHAVAEAQDPGLTTIQLPHREMGAWAARQAIGRLSAEPAPDEHHLMPCPLIERHSVAPPP